MILADAINPAIFLGIGFALFGPLTLLVTAIETYVLRRRLDVPAKAVFGRVLAANLLSTLAGCFLLFLQDPIVYITVGHESIPTFVHGYRWLAPILICAYLAASVIIEGFWVTRRRFLKRIDRPGGAVFKAILIGNLASYLVVGPLFYITTRPYFGGLKTTHDANWSDNADSIVYYIDGDQWGHPGPDDNMVKRKRIGGGEVETLIPFCVQTFLMSDDESTFVFVDCNGDLCAYRAGDRNKTLIRKYPRGCFIWTASISPDNRRVAYRDPPPGLERFSPDPQPEPIVVLDLETGERTEIGTAWYDMTNCKIAWSADGEHVYAAAKDRSEVLKFRADPPYGPPESLTTPPPPSELVVNYGRVNGVPTWIGGRHYVELPEEDRFGPYAYEFRPYLGSTLRIYGDRRLLMKVTNNYGLLNVGLPPLTSVAPLPNGNELLLQWWGQCYVMSVESRRLGLAADGYQFVLRTPEFRITLDPPLYAH